MACRVCYFYMRLTKEQKLIIKELASIKNMTMSQYIWHLIIKDKERLENEM